jgi:hypothetical protein
MHANAYANAAAAAAAAGPRGDNPAISAALGRQRVNARLPCVVQMLPPLLLALLLLPGVTSLPSLRP